MTLFHPHTTRTAYPDERSAEVMRQPSSSSRRRVWRASRTMTTSAVWYQDFLDFVGEQRLFATMCTPAGYGAEDARWDTWRNCEFAEILGFYGLPYWYTWQVSVLGLGPIWMSDNEARQARTAQCSRRAASSPSACPRRTTAQTSTRPR